MEGPHSLQGGTTLILGVGCRPGVDPAVVAAHAGTLLRGIRGSLLCLATIDLRAAEPALLELAGLLGVPLKAFSAAALVAQSDRLTHRSARVHALTGCWGVAESAALAAAGRGGRLVLPRRSWPALTLALAAA